MNIFKQYLHRAKEIIGNRTQDEMKYDSEILRWLLAGKPIGEATAKANDKFPSEALSVTEESLPDLQAHYEYLAGYEEIMRKMKT